MVAPAVMTVDSKAVPAPLSSGVAYVTDDSVGTLVTVKATISK